MSDIPTSPPETTGVDATVSEATPAALPRVERTARAICRDALDSRLAGLFEAAGQ